MPVITARLKAAKSVFMFADVGSFGDSNLAGGRIQACIEVTSGGGMDDCSPLLRGRRLSNSLRSIHERGLKMCSTEPSVRGRSEIVDEDGFLPRIC